MKIRICNPNDKEAWIKMNLEFMVYGDDRFGNGTHEELAETFEQVMNRPEMVTLLIAEDDEGDAIGFANLQSVLSVGAHGKALILDDIYLRKDSQGKGNGSQLLKYIEDYGQANGYKRIQLQAEGHNRRAQEFYMKMGYAGKDRKFYVKNF